MLFSILYRVENYLIYKSNFIVFKFLGWLLYPLYFIVTYFICSYHIEPDAEIAGGFYMHNRDIVITNNVRIGKNFSIMGQTTIGTGFNFSGNIYIGDNVFMGAGAKIIASRELHVADGVDIGANAVVVKDIKEKNSVYGGVPAKFIKYKS
jgi:serine O-acetyltransferase